MKKIFTSALAVMAALPVFANLNTMNYQAVINGTDGQPAANQSIGLRFIIQNNDGVAYSETCTVESNEQGMISWEIGRKAEDGLRDIDWATGNYSLEVAVDLTGGQNYTSVYTSTINSVPSAIFSVNGEEALNEARNAAFVAGNNADAIANLSTSLEDFYADQMNRNENYENFLTVVQEEIAPNAEDALEQAMHNAGEINRLQNDLRNLQSEDQNNKTSIDGLEEATGEMGWIKTDITKLQGDVKGVMDEIDESLYPRIEDAEAALRTVRGDVRGLQNDIDESLYPAIEKNATDIRSNQSEIASIKNEIDESLYPRIEANEANIRTLQGQMTLAATKEEAEEIWLAVEAANENLTMAMNAIKAETEETYATNEAVETMAANYDAIIDKTNNNLGALEKEVEGVKESSEAMASMIDAQLTKTNNNVDAINDEVQVNIEAIANLEELTGETGRIMTDIKALQNKTAATDEAIDNLEEATGEMGWIKTDIKALQNKTAATDEAIDNLEEATGEMGWIKTDIKALQNKTAVTDEAIDNLEELTGETGRIMYLINQLQSKVAELENKIAELEAK